MFNRAALGAIWVYQTYVSPRKGYRCAYAAVHGGTGCSGYIKHTIREEGLVRGWPKIRARFAACKTAYASLRKSGPDDTEAARRSRQRDCWCDVADCGCFAAQIPCSGTKRAAGAKGGLLDTNPCDGDCGVGACSCDINPCS